MKKHMISTLVLIKITLGSLFASDIKEASTVLELTPLLIHHQHHEPLEQAPPILDSKSKCSKCIYNTDWSKASRAEKALIGYKLFTTLSAIVPCFLAPTSNNSPGHSLAYTIYNSVELLNLFIYSLVISEFPETTFIAKSCATTATIMLTITTIFFWVHWYAGIPHFLTSFGEAFLPWVFILMSLKFSQP